MDEIVADVVKQWFHKAENDLRNIRNNLSAEEVPTDTVCFHAQQAIEKLLKGVLVANGMDVGKTHDLVKLLTDTARFIPELLPFEDEFEEISEYGVGVRYPGVISEPTFEDAAKAFEIARKVNEIIRNKVSL
ncbi:MAG: HEPN domain-containing protein [Geobacter sp.]|nr:HEPN domain-containing protein [Geobacter sp.]